MQASKVAKSITKRSTNINTVFRCAASKEKDKEPMQKGKMQAALKPIRVSSPDDPEEKEADDTADKVMRMPSFRSNVRAGSGRNIARSRQTGEELQKQALPISRREDEPSIARKAEGNVNMAANIQAEMNRSMADGTPLPLSVRRFMEPRFQADFSAIKIHTNANAAKLNRRLSAKAFAYQNHIFFGENQYKPDSAEGKKLIAHELTHSIQQGAATQNLYAANFGSPHQPVLETKSSSRPPATHKIGSTNATTLASVQRQQHNSVKVRQRSQTQVQRLGISDALDYFADHAHFIPGFRMFTLLLGVNPINMSRVERSAANVLRAIVEFLPGGAIITTVLDRYGVFEQAGNWISERLDSLGFTITSIKRSVMAFLDSLSWTDIFDLGGVWERAKRLFTEPISRIISFARSLFSRLLRMIKDAMLAPLAQWASQTRGWALLCAVLGRNPITGEPVERSPENVIGGFMRLIGQEEVWENIKRANAIPRAWAWFQGALAGLMGFVRSIPQWLMQALLLLEITDLLSIPSVFASILSRFANFAFTFLRWAGAQVINLLKITFEAVAPGLMPYLRRARNAFSSIVRNPINFVRNLIRAGIIGFRRFATNFFVHLRAGFIGWLTGSLQGTGVHIPKSFSLKEIIKFVLSVLGVTWQNIRLKLVRAVGEPAVAAMERGFEIVKTLIKDGPSALWEQLKTSLANLRDIVTERIMNFVLVRIVQAAITRIVSMLNPAGAFIQAIIAIYNTVMFFVERMRTIMQVARSFLNSMMNIAEGKLRPAAARVEQSMAGMLTLAISFLARLMGLGNITRQITNILTRIRRPIDQAMNRAVNWVVQQARRAGSFVLQAGVPRDPAVRLQRGMQAAKAVLRRIPQNQLGVAAISLAFRAIKTRYGFQELRPYIRAGMWWIHGHVNPVADENGEVSENGEAQTNANGTTADVVDILDSAGNVQIQNYSRENRTGTLKPSMVSGAAIELSKLRFQDGEQVRTENAQTTRPVQYTIAAANSDYQPPTQFRIVDSNNAEENATYSGHRKAFSRAKYKWWRDESAPAPVELLINKGWLFNQEGTEQLARGVSSKWAYIYDEGFSAQEKIDFGQRTRNRYNIKQTYRSNPNIPNTPFNEEHHREKWIERLGKQTEIHHLKPLDFGGDNEQKFIPLSRDMHTRTSQSIHLAFWNPMKTWLLRLRPKR